MILNVKIKKFERLNIFFLSDLFPNDIFKNKIFLLMKSLSDPIGHKMRYSVRTFFTQKSLANSQ